MKFIVLSLALSSFAVVGCSKNPCEQIKTKMEACLNKVPAEVRDRLNSVFSEVTKAPKEQCQAILDNKERLSQLDKCEF